MSTTQPVEAAETTAEVPHSTATSEPLEPSPSTSDTVEAAPELLRKASIGPVSVGLPATSGDYMQAPVPDFMIASMRWSLGNEGVFSVAVESLIPPPLPSDQLIDEFDANGLRWRVYDTGPLDGSHTAAFATLDSDNEISVIVGGQAWELPSNDRLRTAVLQVAQSLTYEKDDS